MISDNSNGKQNGKLHHMLSTIAVTDIASSVSHKQTLIEDSKSDVITVVVTACQML